MEKTAEALRALGVLVDYGPPEAALKERYDFVHLWTSLHFPAQLSAHLDRLDLARASTRVALSTIWAPHHIVRWMDAARRWLFSRFPNATMLTVDSAQNDLRAIAGRRLDFTMDDGERLTAFAPHPYTAECRDVLARVDLILPNSWMELQAIFDGASIQELPEELHAGEYAIMSARFDTRKQQDFAMLALKDLDIPLVFVGNVTDQEIFERMRALAAGRKAPVVHYPFLPQSRLRHLYAGARVHFLPSIFESPGLSSLEAALLDCNIVVGNIAFESEYFESSAYYCDPCDAFSIRRAVETAWDEYPLVAHQRKVLADRIRMRYTWHHAAEATLRAYHRHAMSATPPSAKATPTR